MSSGNTATRASAIDSACRAHVGQGVGRLEPGAVRDGEHAGHAVEHDRETSARARSGPGPGTRPAPAPAPASPGSAGPRRRSPGCRGASLSGRWSARRRRAAPAPSGRPAPAPRRRRRRAGRAGRRARRAGRRGGLVCGHRFSGGQLRREPREDAASTVVVDPGALGDAHAPGGEVVDVVPVDGARERLGGVLLGVVEAARPRRQSTHDAWPGGPELLVGRPHGPMVAAGAERIIPPSGRPCATRWCRRWAPARRPCGPSPRPRPRRRRSR